MLKGLNITGVSHCEMEYYLKKIINNKFISLFNATK